MRVAHPGDRETTNVGDEFMWKVTATAAQELGDDCVGDCRAVVRRGQDFLDPVRRNQAARLALVCQAQPRITIRIEPALPSQCMVDEAESGYAGIGVYVDSGLLDGNNILAY